MFTLQVPIPPGLKLEFEIKLSDDAIRLQCKDGTGADYSLVLKQIKLLCPVASLTASCYENLIRRWQKEAVLFHFQRTEVTTAWIAKGTESFDAASLFTEGSLPSKLYIAFVTRKAYRGNYVNSPFYFGRKWNKDGPTPSPLEQDKDEEEEEEDDNVGDVGEDDPIFLKSVELLINGYR